MSEFCDECFKTHRKPHVHPRFQENMKVQKTQVSYIWFRLQSVVEKDELGFPWSSFISLPRPLSRKNISL